MSADEDPGRSPNTCRRHVLWACSRFCIADGAARRRIGAAYNIIDCINALYKVTSILVSSAILILDIIFTVYFVFSVGKMFSK